jgi:hypothetical protein
LLDDDSSGRTGANGGRYDVIIRNRITYKVVRMLVEKPNYLLCGPGAWFQIHCFIFVAAWKQLRCGKRREVYIIQMVLMWK